jgi:hypothetical protein
MTEDSKIAKTARLAVEAQAMDQVARILLELKDDEKARRVIGAVAVLHGFAEAVWKR